MDIRNVGKQQNVDLSSDRAQRGERQKTVVIPTVGRDDARISTDSREAAAAVEGLAERARTGGSDRRAIVAAALEKLESGALGDPGAIAAAARALLDGNFLAG
jgi:hypothetical protein